jgi:uncharacterized repeat protein (TIGR01451 family)
MFDVFQGSSAASTDIIDALNIAISNQSVYNIVAVNLSLGDSTSNSAQCPSSPFAAAFTSSLNAGIQPVVAAGNSGVKTGLANPACVPGAVSVGAVYDGSYGTVTWGASGASGGQCTDASAADHVTCFSQSASYLAILAPGSFVNAPTADFQQSGTSQATPHISGSIAVLRARYPAETFAEILRRLQVSGVTDTDTANGRSTPRVNLQAAVDQATSVAVSGSGPTTSVAGQVGTYTISITNNGPLDATDVSLSDALPASSTFKSASSGCALVGSTVVCSVGTLAAGGTITLTLSVNWTATGATYDAASVKIDQTNASSQNTVQFGTPPPPVISADGPLPLWAYGLLAAILMGFGSRTARREARR